MTEIIDLTEHVSYMPHGIGDRPILGYIHGENAAIVVDGGCSPQQVGDFLSALGKKRVNAIDAVLLTHGHWDHVSGAKYIVPICLCNPETAYEMEKSVTDFSEENLKHLHSLNKIKDFGYHNMVLEYEGHEKVIEKAKPIVVYGPLRVNLGGVTVAYFPIQTCHCNHCSAIYAEEDQTLFAGDILWPDMESDDWKYSVSALKQLKKQIQKIQAKYIIDSHDQPRTAEYIYAWLDKITAECEHCRRDKNYIPTIDGSACRLEYDGCLTQAIVNAVE